jgi:hypothetical protein
MPSGPGLTLKNITPTRHGFATRLLFETSTPGGLLRVGDHWHAKGMTMRIIGYSKTVAQ